MNRLLISLNVAWVSCYLAALVDHFILYHDRDVFLILSIVLILLTFLYSATCFMRTRLAKISTVVNLLVIALGVFNYVQFRHLAKEARARLAHEEMARHQK